MRFMVDEAYLIATHNTIALVVMDSARHHARVFSEVDIIVSPVDDYLMYSHTVLRRSGEYFPR